MDSKTLLNNIATELEAKLIEEIEAINLIHTTDLLDTSFTVYKGIYNPLELNDYPALLIAVDSQTPHVMYPSFQIDIVLAIKYDDQEILNDKGLRLSDVLINTFLNNHRLGGCLLDTVENIEHMAGSGIYLINASIKVEV